MVHKPKHKVHSFRGLLADDGQDEINLERQNVNIAYRITKFEIISENPGTELNESVVQVFKEKQSSASAVIDFNSPDLLAAAYLAYNYQAYYGMDKVTIFDNILFSRNIFVTHKDVAVGQACNYYIELEEVPVNAATLMQLKLGVARKLNLSENPS